MHGEGGGWFDREAVRRLVAPLLQITALKFPIVSSQFFFPKLKIAIIWNKAGRTDPVSEQGPLPDRASY